MSGKRNHVICLASCTQNDWLSSHLYVKLIRVRLCTEFTIFLFPALLNLADLRDSQRTFPSGTRLSLYQVLMGPDRAEFATAGAMS
jgi:hypothetical protein